MKKIQLLKDPGYLYDLYFIFYLKFNTQLYMDGLLNSDKRAENVEHVEKILAQFGNIPDDLYVFFHAIDTGRIFLTTSYFNPYRNQFATQYNFKYVLSELSDQEKLVRNLIKYYFYEFDDEEVEQCATSLHYVFAAIKNSKYSNEEKNRLYEFFIDPARYIQLLRYELMKKEAVLDEYYKANYQKIIDVYNQTSFESLGGELKKYRIIDIDDNSEIAYISYCLLNRLCISVWFLEDGFMPMLGCAYQSILDCLKNGDQHPALATFGAALCEESRVKILNFIVERGEVTCKDLEKEFSFSGSTAYHHIIVMMKAGLVKSRNEGKTLLYSLNRQYLSNVIGVLNEILNKTDK